MGVVKYLISFLFMYIYISEDAHLMYHFSNFTSSLNEMEPGIAPTDSRWRPDQRTMEGGDFDEANRVKV